MSHCRRVSGRCACVKALCCVGGKKQMWVPGPSQHYVFSGFGLLLARRTMQYKFRPVLPAGLPSPFRFAPPWDTQRFDLKSDRQWRAASAATMPPNPGEFVAPSQASQRRAKPCKSALCWRRASNPRSSNMAFCVNVAFGCAGVEGRLYFYDTASASSLRWCSVAGWKSQRQDWTQGTRLLRAISKQLRSIAALV